ncbi:MAG: hypothetical protein PHX87_05135 [Candidatus Peribacteraceae bacterium]|nr:hypothetical protein [Candidatus Peribacteraceae bacterium]MDD5742780.1 hypothetical protein [Candidatus Peribacteraceae bacterium]
MRRFINPFSGLILLGFALAALHAWQGITTDEAKYLLSIPYPHPPFARLIIGITQGIPGQTLIWRVILAVTLLLAAELARSLAPVRERGATFLLGGLWVLSAAVFVSAGQILLAPVTAVQMLVFCYWYLRGEDLEGMIGWVALLWLVSLFTAYQAILFLPLVAAVFWRMRIARWQRVVALGGPVLLLALYTVVNPLAFASMVTAGGQNLGGGSPLIALQSVAWLWILGGSLAASILGTIGMLSSQRWPLIVSLLLVAGFTFLSFRPYYGILFTPLLLTGLATSPTLLRRTGTILLCTLVCALVIIPLTFPKDAPSPVPSIYRAAEQAGIPAGATAIIAGPFGHQWQYGPYIVRRMVGNLQLLDSARVAVCLTDCPAIRGREGWEKLPGVSVEVWVRPLR